MKEIQFIGEHLWPGLVGHSLVLLSFVLALLALISFYFATRNASDLTNEKVWRKIAEWSFFGHSLTIYAVIGLLMYMMLNRWYEYYYVFEHVNDSLPISYLLSAFWEGQEGSFYLWMFWHSILGLIIMFRNREWSAPVLAVLSAIQLVLTSMVLGIYFPGTEFKIGNSPFTLLREIMDIPLFERVDYLDLIEGKGLNELLQNYWNLIHPPTLFLGFSSLTIPFCFAIAGLWTGKHKAWLKPAFSWALFAGGILGVGLLMGAAWAYEALSFNGYWAWDPVENTSLVPWLLLLAGIHVNLISNATGHNIKGTYFFYLFSFLSSVYSTLLTRSGVLGDSSQHAFTQMGLEWQLVFFLTVFMALGIFLLCRAWKSIPEPPKEESISSREFWMFIGSLVLLLSSILINFTTSIPVYNKVADLLGYHTDWSPPLDPIAHYNKYQIWIGVFIGLLSGMAQTFRFREQSWKSYRKVFFRRSAWHLSLAAILTAVVVKLLSFTYWVNILILFAAAYTIFSNIDLLIRIFKTHKKTVSGVISHVGFGLLIFGILISGNKQYHLSSNSFAQMGLIEGLDYEKNMLLYKNVPIPMKEYWVNFSRDTVIENHRYLYLDYYKLDSNGDTTEQFTMVPNVIYNRESEFAATNPSTRHYLHKDIFTNLTNMPSVMYGPKEAKAAEDSIDYKDILLSEGDTMKLEKYTLIFEGLDFNSSPDQYMPVEDDILYSARFKLIDHLSQEQKSLQPSMLLREGFIFHYPAHAQNEHIKIKLSEENLDRYYPTDFVLNYDTILLQKGHVFSHPDYVIELKQLTVDSEHIPLDLLPGDLAVMAHLGIQKENQSLQAEPIFLLRNKKVSSPRLDLPEYGLYIKFVSILPETNEMVFAIAQSESEKLLDFKLTEKAGRTDFIVIESILYPGMNLVWLGALMMMLGLFSGLILRSKKS